MNTVTIVSQFTNLLFSVDLRFDGNEYIVRKIARDPNLSDQNEQRVFRELGDASSSFGQLVIEATGAETQCFRNNDADLMHFEQEVDRDWRDQDEHNRQIAAMY